MSTPTPRIPTLLARTPPFDRLPREVLNEALGDVLVASYLPEERILAQGSRNHTYLFVVAAGHVRLFDTVRQQLVDACGEGDCFGHYGLLQGGSLPYEARAVEATTCALLPAARFRALCDHDPTFAAFFDRDLKQHERSLRAPLDAAGARFLFHTPLGDLVHREPVTCPPGTTARTAARVMREAQVGSLLVVQDGRALGILTSTDLRDRVLAEGASPDAPVEHLMSSPVIGLDAAAPLFEALLLLMRHRMHHLAVTDGTGPDAPVRGVISDQDIIRVQGASPAALVERIAQAGTLAALTGIRAALEGLLLQLHQQGVRPEDLIALGTDVNDRLTLRVLHLIEAALAAEQPDARVDVPWAWMALGSEGRREMSLKTDQDNALVYADPASPAEAERAERWFALLAARANEALERCGLARCPGDVMASNPRWRQPLRRWKQYFRQWITEPDPQALMHASIFFDLRSLCGAHTLVDALKQDILEVLDRTPGFLAFLTHNALSTRPPLSFFRRFVLERSGEHLHTFDIKLRGLMPVVDLARLLALETRYLDVANTLDRLHHARQRLPRLAASIENARDAYRYLVDLRLAHQLDAVAHGRPPDNHVDPAALSKVQQNMLKAVFAAVGDLQEVLAHRYGAEFMRH